MSKVLQWMTTKMEEQQVVAKAAAAVAAGDASSSARAISKMDPAAAAAAGFKLFGKTIAVAATTAAACVLSDAGADAGALFGMRVAAHWATAAPSCSQVCCCCSLSPVQLHPWIVSCYFFPVSSFFPTSSLLSL
jgi:hypothetical protein